MPKIVDKEAKRHSVINAAYELFIEKGFKDVTTREIAIKAGVSKGVLYDYFKNKEDLFYQTVSEHMSKMIALKIESVDSDLTPREKLNRFHEISCKHNEMRKKRYHMMFDFVLNCKDENLLQEYLGNLYDIIRQYTRKFFVEIYPEVFNHEEKAVLYTNMIVGFLEGIHIQDLTNPDKAKLKETFELFWDLLNIKLKAESENIASEEQGSVSAT
ncbi:MAG: TetR/AcrR family transcriptional regulator [bacterium]|nr:TetR/AcrR family transcriptional regulator [bacterium]